MKLVSWNVNGLRACLSKGFMDVYNSLGADFFCLQEIKMTRDQGEIETPGAWQFWNSAEKKGYSGTLVIAKKKPLSAVFGIDGAFTDEGRVVTLEYPSFFLVCAYVPNAQDGLRRLAYRMEYEDAVREYLVSLSKKKCTVYCGDLNVAHKEIDLKNPKANVGNPGFSDEEREKMTRLLDAGFTDTFRLLHPDARDAYSWWSYRARARENNVGWRIDYFLVSSSHADAVKGAGILSGIVGSDHCPVWLELDENLL